MTVEMPTGTPPDRSIRVILSAVLVAVGISVEGSTFQEMDPAGSRASDASLQQIVQDLEAFIPQRLRDADVPGLSIVLIRGHRIAWRSGFGVRNRYSRRPVTPRTVMQVGSISKAVGSYGALKLADRGVITLDTPLDDYLESPWLADPVGRRRITMRQVLTHTSGLSNDVAFGSRDLLFPPGERYSYSGMGFQYLQAVLEATQGRTINAIMEDEVFEPLEMSSASFDPVFGAAGDVAAGHMPLSQVNSMVLQPFAVVAAVLAALGLASNRVRRKTWSLGWKGRLFVAAAAVFLVAASLVRVLGVSLSLAMCAAASTFVVCGTVLIYLGVWLVRRFSSRFRSSGPKTAFLVIAWSLAVFGVLWVVSARFPIPVPGVPSRGGGLAWSLKTTAEDLARFALALMSMDETDPSLTGLMLVPQISVSDRTAWGMGIGLRDGDDGPAFFHTGVNLGFESLLYGIPDTGAGVVILTNGSGGLRVAQDIAVRVLGPSADGLQAATAGTADH